MCSRFVLLLALLAAEQSALEFARQQNTYELCAQIQARTLSRQNASSPRSDARKDCKYAQHLWFMRASDCTQEAFGFSQGGAGVDRTPRTAQYRRALPVYLRGGGRPKDRLGGKPLPGGGHMGRVGRRSPRDPLGKGEQTMIARSARHRRKSARQPKDNEGWFKKEMRQAQGLIDPKKGERPSYDTRNAKPRPSSIERFVYRRMYDIEPQKRPPKTSVLEEMVVGTHRAVREIEPVEQLSASKAAAGQVPTPEVLEGILARLTQWEKEKDMDDESIPLRVRATMRLVRAAKRSNTTDSCMHDVLAALKDEADINGIDTSEVSESLQGYTALQHAVTKGCAPLVRLLLRRGCDVHAVNALGDTALHHAAALGHAAIVRQLLDAGARVNARSTAGVTPLHWAARNDAAGCVSLLLDAGANASLPAAPWRDAQLKIFKHVPGINCNAMELAVMACARSAVAVFKDRNMLPQHLMGFNTSKPAKHAAFWDNGCLALVNNGSHVYLDVVDDSIGPPET